MKCTPLQVIGIFDGHVNARCLVVEKSGARGEELVFAVDMTSSPPWRDKADREADCSVQEIHNRLEDLQNRHTRFSAAIEVMNHAGGIR